MALRSPLFHPQRDDQGRRVPLHRPHAPTDAASWRDPQQLATVTPGHHDLPAVLNGVPFESWIDPPSTPQAWAAVAGQQPDLNEPPLPPLPPDTRRAAGVVVIEADGRIWTVSPSNQFGGYDNTFPKGTLEPGLSPQACAIKEAFEETGLRVEIQAYLVDVPRSTSLTRYYRARRIGGHPADMGWESQAVHLVPRAHLAQHTAHPYDQPLIDALRSTCGLL